VTTAIEREYGFAAAARILGLPESKLKAGRSTRFRIS
jgi:hypothetical protein